ncbi:hypothetical protein [Bordetella muralis]|uniref:hypothetical protein n=1 Tax=Bordetella muralis TaxID=1649130 RepID=UPI0039EE27CC
MAAFGQSPASVAGSISGQIGLQTFIEPSCMISNGSSGAESTEQWARLILVVPRIFALAQTQ